MDVGERLGVVLALLTGHSCEAPARASSTTATRLTTERPTCAVSPAERYPRCWARNLNALAMTLTEDSAIAAAAIMGDSSRPNAG